MTNQAQYARGAAEAVALLLKNDIDIWWTYDVIRERIDAAGIEGEDLDGYIYMRDLIRAVRNALLDGWDLGEALAAHEGFFATDPKGIDRIKKNREVLAPVMGYLAPEKFRPSSAERN